MEKQCFFLNSMYNFILLYDIYFQYHNSHLLVSFWFSDTSKDSLSLLRYLYFPLVKIWVSNRCTYRCALLFITFINYLSKATIFRFYLYRIAINIETLLFIVIPLSHFRSSVFAYNTFLEESIKNLSNLFCFSI